MRGTTTYNGTLTPENAKAPTGPLPSQGTTEGMDPTMATATLHTRRELRVFYALVLGLALYGQSTGASTWLIPADAGPLQALLLWVLVIAFVLVLELGAVVLLRRAETQRRAGQRAAVAIIAAIALASGAAGLSWIGHWGEAIADQIQAYAFAGATLLGVLVWAIMADLSIDATVSRLRSVESAVRRYVKHLDMDDAEKAVLLATMDVPMITRLITDGPDALAGADKRDRNVRIAEILARAIDPSTWHGGAKSSKAEPKPTPVRTERDPKPTERPAAAIDPAVRVDMNGTKHPADLPPAAARGPEWELLPIEKRAEAVWGECAIPPSAQQFAIAIGCAKSTANEHKKKLLASE